VYPFFFFFNVLLDDVFRLFYNEAVFFISWNLARDAVGNTDTLVEGILKKVKDARITFITPDHEMNIYSNECLNQFFMLYL
jgi:hypothetical protein